MAVAIQDQAQNTVQMIVSVYMPFYSRSNIRLTNEFLDTLYAIQVLIDEYSACMPIKLCGDLVKNWYKHKGFTCHSQFLYDFLVANNMIVADFLYQQPVK